MATLNVGDRILHVRIPVRLVEDENGTFVRVQFTPRAFLDLELNDADVLAKRLMGVKGSIKKPPDPRQITMF